METFEPNRTTQEIAASLGSISVIPNIPTVQTLILTNSTESTLNVYSGNYGFGRFPWHTDLAHWYLPPRYLLLRCIIPAQNVFTSLLRTETAIKSLTKSTIRRAMFTPRRRIYGHLPLLRFCQCSENSTLFRWDRLFLNSANVEAVEVSTTLRELEKASKFEKIYLKNTADTVIIDNWLMLHGRSKVPQTDMHRIIERIYLERFN